MPKLLESNYDFGNLLAEAHEMDGVHDLTFLVDYQSFPVHRFIIYHRCRHLRKLAEKQPTEKEIHLKGYEGLTASIFELVLRYIYTNEVLAKGDVEKLVGQLHPGGTVEEMVTRLRKVFKQLEIGALNESLKKCVQVFYDPSLGSNDWFFYCSLSDDPTVEDFPKLSRDSYPDLRDVTIRLQDNQEIKAHKCILMARLEYFNMMFSHTWTEVRTDLWLKSIEYYQWIPFPNHFRVKP